jgi:hypothetical protein
MEEPQTMGYPDVARHFVQVNTDLLVLAAGVVFLAIAMRIFGYAAWVTVLGATVVAGAVAWIRLREVYWAAIVGVLYAAGAATLADSLWGSKMSSIDLLLGLAYCIAAFGFAISLASIRR